jgi:catechol 2,3-dioxygenase-like lactoylglutathione lyase family enzyme
MIGYVILGTGDLGRAAIFYDGLLDGADAKRLIETGSMIAWGSSWDKPMVAVAVPEDGAAADPGHGNLLALVQPSRAKVDSLFATAITLGAADDGAPSFRGAEGDQGFYAGYVRDPDGNRLCLFFVGARN